MEDGRFLIFSTSSMIVPVPGTVLLTELSTPQAVL